MGHTATNTQRKWTDDDKRAKKQARQASGTVQLKCIHTHEELPFEREGLVLGLQDLEHRSDGVAGLCFAQLQHAHGAPYCQHAACSEQPEQRTRHLLRR